ncbi:MAG TPA: hypothetical protein VFV34_23325 [Blastocatellia bacterium]|nr:hypothetical protein [Blastocatellia bacterium]
MKRLNWTIILYDIIEAREQLQEIEARAKSRAKPNEFDLQVMLEHAYHHLNFAWNVRHQPTNKYANLDDRDFNKWSKFPREMKPLSIPVRRKGARNTKAGARRRQPKNQP